MIRGCTVTHPLVFEQPESVRAAWRDLLLRSDRGGLRSRTPRDAMQKTLGVVLDAPSLSAPSFELGFKVSDCDAAFSELVAAGAPAVTRPTTRSWGQRTAYVRDPDGNLVELAQAPR